MISFNTNDFNILKVSRESKLFNLQTDLDYQVYGLRLDENPLMLITYNIEEVSEDILNDSKEAQLTRFFRKNNLQLEWQHDDQDTSKIFIGLRYDLRKHVALSSACLQTIIYFIEGRLNMRENYSIPGIPRFVDRIPKLIKKEKKLKPLRFTSV